MKKNIMIPFEKYEKLMAQSKVDTPDGQCVSHTHHLESNRDKLNEYGVRVENQKDDELNSNLSFGFQKGEGGFQVNASALSGVVTPPTHPPPGLSPNGRESPTIRASPNGGGSYRHQAGPPGRRETTKSKRKRKWEHF